MRRTYRSTTILGFLAALAATPLAHAVTTAPVSGLALRGVAFPAASIDEADSIANQLGFERLVRTGPGWRVISRLRNGSLLWYAAGHDTAIGGHGDTLAVPLFTGLPVGIEIGGLPVGAWTEAEGEAKAMPHPNGAVELIGMTAEVPDVDATCEAWARAGASCGPREFPHGEGSEMQSLPRTITLPGGGTIRLSPTRGAVVGNSGRLRWTGVLIATRTKAPADAVSGSGKPAPRSPHGGGFGITFVPR